MRAIYRLPFPDFDYEPIVESCGARMMLNDGIVMAIEGSREAIDMVSANLDFEPDSVEG